MKAGDCENSLQIVDNMTIVIGKAIVTCPNTADCSCFFSNDTATYIINNDIMNISFKTLKTERQYNFNERDISTIQRSMELRKK